MLLLFKFPYGQCCTNFPRTNPSPIKMCMSHDEFTNAGNMPTKLNAQDGYMNW